MFSKEDYHSYFEEAEKVLRDTIELYTDLLNDLSTKAIHNKIHSLAAENMEAFKIIRDKKKSFS